MNNAKTKPEVGMGATYCIGSDRYAYTIVDVIKNAREIVIQADHMGKPNNKAALEYATLRNDGRYIIKGSSCGTVRVGARDEYSDPSF